MVLLHPQGCLSGRTTTIAPSDVLFYQSLLYTNKPYLVNTLLASAAHSLFLCAQNSAWPRNLESSLRAHSPSQSTLAPLALALSSTTGSRSP